MKANSSRLRPTACPLAQPLANRLDAGATALIAALPLALLLSACASAPAPPPAPLPSPAAVAPRPAIAAHAPQDWRDAPLAEGEWHWARQGDTSVARFGAAGQAPLLILRCIRSAGQVALLLATPPMAPLAPDTSHSPVTGSSQTSMTIITSNLTRPLLANPAGRDDDTTGLSIAILARDPLLDEIAFSRGRWRIEAEGLPPLTVPSWPEVARVVEDCR